LNGASTCKATLASISAQRTKRGGQKKAKTPWKIKKGEIAGKKKVSKVGYKLQGEGGENEREIKKTCSNCQQIPAGNLFLRNQKRKKEFVGPRAKGGGEKEGEMAQ